MKHITCQWMKIPELCLRGLRSSSWCIFTYLANGYQQQVLHILFNIANIDNYFSGFNMLLLTDIFISKMSLTSQASKNSVVTWFLVFLWHENNTDMCFIFLSEAHHLRLGFRDNQTRYQQSIGERKLALGNSCTKFHKWVYTFLSVHTTELY